MLWIIKLVKKVLKTINSNARLWQIWLGVFIGVMLGFLPVWPSLWEPSLLALCLIGVVIVINVHLGSVLLFMGIGTLIAMALRGVADALAPSLDGLAGTLAGVGFLYKSHLTHTGHLALAAMGLAVAVVIASAFATFASYFRKTLKAKLLERKKLVKAGKTVGNPWVLRLAKWFFDL